MPTFKHFHDGRKILEGLSLYNPDGQPLPDRNPNDRSDAILILHALTEEQKRQLLQTISGRASRAKYLPMVLAYLQTSRRPVAREALNAIVKKYHGNLPNTFLNFLREYGRAHGLVTARVRGAKAASPQQAASELPDSEQVMDNFEETGKLSRRLQWAMEQEERTQPLVYAIVAGLLNKGVRPTRYSNPEANNALSGKIEFEQSPQADRLRRIRAEVTKQVFLDLADDRVDHNELAAVLQNIERLRAAALDPDEAVAWAQAIVRQNPQIANTSSPLPNLDQAGKRFILMRLGNQIREKVKSPAAPPVGPTPPSPGV